MKIVVTVNTTWNIVNFRKGLILALVDEGHEVVVLSPTDDYVPMLMPLYIRHIPIAINSQSRNIVNDLRTLAHYIAVFKSEKPDLVLAFTAKPNIYGSLAAWMTSVNIINNIAGLGTAFVKQGLFQNFVIMLYRFSLSNSKKVFFQNSNDRDLFIDKKVVSENISSVLPGSGVDLNAFPLCELPAKKNKSKVRFLMVCRLLWDKGISQFYQASKLLKKKGVDVEFCILGPLSADGNGPDESELSKMSDGITFLGKTDDVLSEMRKADCIVLPSYYREGVPRALLEALATGRPIITTDSVGCREVIDHGKNGFLCLPRDSVDLASKMSSFLELSDREREIMSLKSRELAETKFDENLVISHYKLCIKELT
jgi:glycosyltransferase involved in cell wall biosynthesis